MTGPRPDQRMERYAVTTRQIARPDNRVVYSVIDVDDTAVEHPSEGTVSLTVLAEDGRRITLELVGITPGMLIDALLASRTGE